MKLSTLPIYDKHIAILQALPEGELEPIIRAVFAYSQDQELPELSPMAKGIFEFIKISIDNSKAKAENGAKGGSKSKQDESKVEAEGKQTEANVKQSEANESKAEAIKILKIKNEKQEIKNKTTTPVARECDFDELWNLYPRKEGRERALQAFKRWIHAGDTVNEIRAGIENYNAYIRSNNTERRYIKQGATYFTQRAWKDKLEIKQDFIQRTDDMEGVLMDL